MFLHITQSGSCVRYARHPVPRNNKCVIRQRIQGQRAHNVPQDKISDCYGPHPTESLLKSKPEQEETQSLSQYGFSLIHQQEGFNPFTNAYILLYWPCLQMPRTFSWPVHVPGQQEITNGQVRRSYTQPTQATVSAGSRTCVFCKFSKDETREQWYWSHLNNSCHLEVTEKYPLFCLILQHKEKVGEITVQLSNEWLQVVKLEHSITQVFMFPSI